MKEREERPVPWRWIATVAVLLVAGLAALGVRRPKGVPVQAAPASRADLVVPILCDGTLEPLAGGELRSPESAMVGEVLVAEGQRVGKGTPLVRLEAPGLAQQALDARGLALQLAAERTRAAAELDEARREAGRLRKRLDADGRLLAERAISRSAYEDTDTSLRAAEERGRSAEARWLSLAGAPGGPPSRLALAETSAATLETRVAALTLHAPVDGVAYGLPRKPRELVPAGQVVASVSDPARHRLRTRVDQPDLPRVAAGQRLLVTFDGLPEKKWEGTIRLVSPGLREVAGREVGEVLGEIDDPSSSLPPNASVNVQIVVGERKNVLVIPRAALLKDGEKRFVYVLAGDRARRRDITVGLVGLTEVEVTGGLAEKERVLLPGAASLSEGLLVAAREG